MRSSKNKSKYTIISLCLLLSCVEKQSQECTDLRAVPISEDSDLVEERYRILDRPNSSSKPLCVEATEEAAQDLCYELYRERLRLDSYVGVSEADLFPGLIFATSRRLNDTHSSCEIPCDVADGC